MGFLDKLKHEAETTEISDHPLYTGEYREEVRRAFLSGAVAAMVFLDGELSPSGRAQLMKLGKSLHLAVGEIEEILQTVLSLGESEQLSYLKEVFALMDSEFLKYSLTERNL